MNTIQNTKIFVRGLEVQASIGVHPHEYEAAQLIIIDVELDMAGIEPPTEDKLVETLDYAVIAETAAEFALEAHVRLVETLAARIARWALDVDARVQACTVSIAKPHALVNADAAGVTYTLTRDD
ncbi:MAG: dihydroneopterin aldolase [Acidimicrobiales bacterium]|nr:dihydroneopterin aldolase [Hyphomonadaceae bacterium]RZV38752.1 MAG: dihydroneopterin aldolase [Acidimicrobiales bacterium]